MARKPLTTIHVGALTAEQRRMLRFVPTARRVEVLMAEAQKAAYPPSAFRVHRSDDGLMANFIDAAYDLCDISQEPGSELVHVSVENRDGVLLDRETAAQIIPLLERFVATGTIEEVTK